MATDDDFDAAVLAGVPRAPKATQPAASTIAQPPAQPPAVADFDAAISAGVPRAPPKTPPPPPASEPQWPPPASPPGTPTALDRVIQAGREGFQDAPTILSGDQRDAWMHGGWIARNIGVPATDLASTVGADLYAGLRGGQQAIQETVEGVLPGAHLPSLPPGVSIPLGGNRSLSGELTPGSLGHEVAALPEAYPFGLKGVMPEGPGTFAEARAGANRGTFQVGKSQTPPITAEELAVAARRAAGDTGGVGTGTGGTPTGGASGPASVGPEPVRGADGQWHAPGLPPVPDGHTRVYHGGDNPTSGGSRWVTPDYRYARDYRPGQTVHYTDVPNDHPAMAAATDHEAAEGTAMKPPVRSFNAPEDIASQLKPVDPSDTGPRRGTTGAPEAEPAPGPQQPFRTPRTATEAKALGSSQYTEATRLGGVLSSGFANRFFDRMRALFPEDTHGTATGGKTAVDKLMDSWNSELRDKPMTLHNVQAMDERLGMMIDAEWTPKGPSKVAGQLRDIQRAFRDAIADARPEDVMGGMDGFNALARARGTWAQAMKMDDIERMWARAQNTPNPPRSFAKYAKAFLDNRAESRGWTKPERGILKEGVRRSFYGGTMALAGNHAIPWTTALIASRYGSIWEPAITWTGAQLIGGAARRAAARSQAGRATKSVRKMGKLVPPPPSYQSPSAPPF